MINKAEERISAFYNSVGWETEGEITEDARRYEDLRESAKEYVSRCRLRVLRHIPDSGDKILDMASGPIQYKEYLEFSKNYRKRYCVDLSSGALEDAKKKIGDRGEYLCGSFFDLKIEENFFDCTISLHTLYHIDKDRQEEIVRKLLTVTKPGQPVIIVYSNPKTYFNGFRKPFQKFRSSRVGSKLRSLLKKNVVNAKKEQGLYFYCHPINWWEKFTDVAEMQILPWRSFTKDEQVSLFPNNWLGKKMFRSLFRWEDRCPRFFVKHFQYPMIILKKKN